MYEHKKLVQHYRVSKSGLQAQLEAGITFKKSTSKSVPELDFVPVNLHIQQMKVTAKETENKGVWLFSCACLFDFTSLLVLQIKLSTQL